MSRFQKELQPGPFWGQLLNPKEGIFEDSTQGIATFYVAGYSKKIDGIEMQNNYIILWNYMTQAWKCTVAKTNAKFQPNQQQYNYVHTGNGRLSAIRAFGSSRFDEQGNVLIGELLSVRFEYEPDNRYDPYAIKVHVTTHAALLSPKDRPPFEVPEEMLLGYVPRKLNKIISRYQRAIIEQRVDKVRSMQNLFSARVNIKYNPEIIYQIESDYLLTETKTQIIGEENSFSRLRDVLG